MNCYFYYMKLLLVKHNCFLVIFVCFLFYSCKNPESDDYFLYMPREKVQTNFIIYMAADNNLERFALQNISDMKKIGSTDNCNIIVLLDRAFGYDKSEDDWTDTRLFLLTKDNRSFNYDLVYSFNELDMTQSSTLEMFLLFCDNNFPSENTVLTIWSHGTGVFPDGMFENNINLGVNKSVIHDYTAGYDKSMSIKDLSSVLTEFVNKRNKKIDILIFDSCLMQMVEICWELKDVSNIIIASQGDVPAGGFDYTSLVSLFTEKSLLDEITISSEIVDSFYAKYNMSLINTSCSALNMNYFNQFSESFIKWSRILVESLSDYSKIKEIRESLYSYSSIYKEFIDLPSLLKLFYNSNFENKNLNKVSKNLELVLQNFVISNKVTNEYNSLLCGISINFPSTIYEFSFYRKENCNDSLKIFNESFWNEFLNNYYTLLNSN